MRGPNEVRVCWCWGSFEHEYEYEYEYKSWEDGLEGEIARVVVFDIHGELRESFEKVKAILREAEMSGSVKEKVAAAAELRKHIELAGRMLEVATRAEAVAEFEAGVIEALAEEGVVVRRRVMGLFEKRQVES